MEVLIVGAGPTGLTMANELARQRVKFRIIDSAPGPCEQSRALGIHARTLEHLDMMGLIDNFLAEGNKCHGISMYDNGKRIISLSLAELSSPYPYVLILPQSITEALLQDSVQRLGNEVERNTDFVALEQFPDYVLATTRKKDGQEEQERYDWVIGCDGAHSAVRHGVKATFHGSAYSEAFLLADVSIAGGDVDRSAISIYTVDEGLLAVFPFGKDRARIIADNEVHQLDAPSERDAQMTMPAPSFEQIEELVMSRGPRGMTVTDPRWLAAFRIHRRQVDSYRHGRVFLCGDAAHIHSPAGGQGMNTGIQDAINLAWKLALVVHGAAPEKLLDSYQDERHKIGEAVLKFTDFLTKTNMTRNQVTRAIKNKIAPFIMGQEIIQQHVRDEVSELAIKYRGSPIVEEKKVSLIHTKTIGHSFDKGPHAGDRAPDCELQVVHDSAVRTLFQLLRTPEHHLLLFSGIRATPAGNNNLAEIASFVVDKFARYIKVHVVVHNLQTVSDAAIGASYVVDQSLAMHLGYGANSDCLYLIRPDGYVGFRSLPADKLAVAEYLCKIFA